MQLPIIPMIQQQIWKHSVLLVRLKISTSLFSNNQCINHYLMPTDSKSLTAERREELFEMIGKKCKNLGWRANALSPVTISNCMLKRFKNYWYFTSDNKRISFRSKYNLNALSHDTAISLIEELQKAGVNITHVYVDTVGPAGSYQAKLSNLFPDFKIKVANKADATFPIVSAASVCAKVIRDKIIEKWEFVELINFKDAEYGSGYPSGKNNHSYTFLVCTNMRINY